MSLPLPPRPGAELTALRRFHVDTTWTGTTREGGMGPGTPATTAEGRGRHEVIQDGRWMVGSYEQDQYLLDGEHVLTWKLHWVAGWSPVDGQCRATVADVYGHAEVMRSWIDGDRLVFESVGDPPVRIRLTWQLDGSTVLWRNEMSVQGGTWFLVEDYACTPAAADGTATAPR